MLKIADRIVCPSKYEYENFLSYFPFLGKRLILIENTFEVFPKNPQIINGLKEKYDIKKNNKCAIYVGRLEQIKGADFLLKNLASILSRHQNLKFFIIGKALDKTLFKKLISLQKKFKNQLFYIKYVEKELLFQYYYLCNFFINPSLSESFSLATHEAAYCENALILNSIPVFDKFKEAAIIFNTHLNNGCGFHYGFEKLIKSGFLVKRKAKLAKKIAKKALENQRMKADFAKLLSTL